MLRARGSEPTTGSGGDSHDVRRHGRERDGHRSNADTDPSEIAALFLAMLLLGSGAYLLRRRQSGGLTPA